jgi:hypothetical protein
VFTARYALSPYIKQIRFVFKGLNTLHTLKYAKWSFVLRAEHRSAPFDKDILNLRYYGGAEGNVLLYHPTLGLTPVQQQETVNKDDDENVGEEDGQGGGGSGGGSGNGEADDGVTIQLPPPGTVPLF